MPHPESEHGLRVQLATALRERDEARDDLGASHSRGAHLHCSKDRCDVAADGMALAAANARADAATTKAEQYERDWYAAKNDFGNAMAKSREALAAARRECEEMRTSKELVQAGGWLAALAVARREINDLTSRLAVWDDHLRVVGGVHACEQLLKAAMAAYEHLDSFGVVVGGTPREHESQRRAFDMLRPFVTRRAALGAPGAAAGEDSK